MFECDRVILIGFITGSLSGAAVAGTLILNNAIIAWGIIGPLVGLVALYLPRRKEWIKKEKNCVEIQEEIAKMLKEHEKIPNT